MTIQQLADKYIPASDGKVVLKKEGRTDDIIAEVIAAYKDSKDQLKNFAPYLKGNTLQQTLQNVWNFWKFNIRYQKDPSGQQWVQEPRALWARKSGDCKSLSIATMATLNSLGIKAAFRFTSYGFNKTFPTHVYVVVQDKGRVIPVDCVWKEFGTQKAFTKNWDYDMTQISRLSGFDNSSDVGFLFGAASILKKLKKKKKKNPNAIPTPKRGVLKIPAHATPELCNALLLKQRLEMEQQINARKQKAISGIGIGCPVDKGYEMQIVGLHNALAGIMGWDRMELVDVSKVPIEHRNDFAVSGIGCLEPTHQDAQTVAAIEGFFGSIFKGIKSVGKAIGKGAKAVGKGVLKVATAPAKLLVKGVKAVGKLAGKLLTGPARKAIQEQLPQAAPFFLYTFITDPKILSKLPEPVKIKRDKALSYKKIITGKLQIADSNFTGTVRNGIMNAYGLSPEDVIAKWIKDSNYKIGLISEAIQFGAKALGGIAKMILGDTGENLMADAENYAPRIEDWGGVTPAAASETAADIQQQNTNMMPYTSGQLNTQMQAYSTQPYSSSGGTMVDFSGGGSAGNDYGKVSYDGTGDYPDAGSKLAPEQTLDNVDIQTDSKARPLADEQPKKSNTGMIMAFVAGGLLLATTMGGGSKKKKRA